MVTEQFIDIFAVASFSLGLFGAVLCLLHSKDVWPFRALAFVLLVSCAMELEDLPLPFLDADRAATYDMITTVIWLIGLTSIAPLFWHYVSALTAVRPKLPRPLWLHFIVPGLAVLLAMSLMAIPQAARLGLFVDGYPLPPGWPLWVGITGELLVLVAVIQWGIYGYATVRVLLRYRIRLKTYVANTAQIELTWIWVVIVAFSAYWTIGAIDALFELTSPHAFVSPIVESILGLAMLVVILLFGLRQRPGLAPDVVATAPGSQKYERSALTDEVAARLEGKLRRVMGEDKLHRDPNLSLWALARHIGASPNYISQTLNDRIGESFFDFVNGYRIADAQDFLSGSDQTVLAIAYEVGFNSRSSFYTAFKKVTGQTPTAYRAAVSAPA